MKQIKFIARAAALACLALVNGAQAQSYSGSGSGYLTNSVGKWDSGRIDVYKDLPSTISFNFQFIDNQIVGSYRIDTQGGPSFSNRVYWHDPTDYIQYYNDFGKFEISNGHAFLTLVPDVSGVDGEEAFYLEFDKEWLKDPTSQFNGRAHVVYYVNAQSRWDGDLRGYANFTFGAGVPEPAAWATMIAGFAIAGSALRRRRSPVRKSVTA
jgi:hypothetical protein